MKRILSVDDHGIISIGLENIAQKLGDGAIVGSARESREMFRLLREEKWDLVVLDISLGGKSGLEVLKDIKHYYPNLPVLIFSLHTGIEFVRRSLKDGASGYISKDKSEEDLIEAINSVLSGGHYISEEHRDELIFSPKGADHTGLSGREFEVLVKIGEGKTVREIAADLGISENTVDTYRSRVKEKMNLKRDAELIRYCIGAGLVSADIPYVEEEPPESDR
ncbi:MAG: response regulator transcription factor [Pyrinomonadaceae bacterium]